MRIIDLNKRIGENPIERYIRNRIKNNKNFIACFLGETGAGKSVASIRLAEDLDPTFNINRIFFSTLGFIKKVKELMDRSEAGEDIKGKVLVFDEIGISQDSRSWYSKENKNMNYLLQSFRAMNVITLMSVPYISFTDKNTRALFHALFVADGIDMRKKLSYFRPYFSQINAKSGKQYLKYLRVPTKNGGLIKLSRARFKLPSEDLLNAYEAKKRRFMSGLYDEMVDTLDESAKKDEKKKEVIKLTAKQEKIKTMIEDKYTKEAMMKEMNFTHTSLYGHFKALRKKGFKIQGIWSPEKDKGVTHYIITRES